MKTGKILQSPFNQVSLDAAQDKLKKLENKKKLIIDYIFEGCQQQFDQMQKMPLQAERVNVVLPPVQVQLEIQEQVQPQAPAPAAIIPARQYSAYVEAVTHAWAHAWAALKPNFKNIPELKELADAVPEDAGQIKQWLEANEEKLKLVTYLDLQIIRDLPDWFFTHFKGLEAVSIGSGFKGELLKLEYGKINLPSSLASCKAINMITLDRYVNTVLPDWFVQPLQDGTAPLPNLKYLYGPGLSCRDNNDSKKIEKITAFFKLYPDIQLTPNCPLLNDEKRLAARYSR